MKKFLALLTAVASLVAVSATAMPREGFYAGGFGGANFLHIGKHGDFDHKFRTGYAAGVFVGYEWCQGLRLEGEASYRYNRIKCAEFDDGEVAGCFRKGHLCCWSYMANVLYDIDLSCWTCDCNSITPYIGAGIGWANQRFKLGHTDLDDEDRHGHDRGKGFAWQLIAGLSYEICPCTDLAIEYRFFKGHAKHIYSNYVGLSARYHF